MKILKSVTVVLTLLGFSGAAVAKESILVILSGENKITLKKDPAGTSEVIHDTGFFLTELMVPLKALLDAGYDPVFATPNGTKPVMDAVSDNAFWFGGDEREHRRYRSLCEKLELCGKGRVGALDTKSFAGILEEGLNRYAAVFFPGGHAPMEDLFKNKQLGEVLKHFHDTEKPTALICHAPIALLSTLEKAEEFGEQLAELNRLNANPTANRKKAQKVQENLTALSVNWIYRGYRMTSFSTKEEQQEEPGGADGLLGGYMKFYPDEGLDFAGGKVLVRAQKWQSNVVQDRELITGQNPFSDKEFAGTLLRALEKK